MNPLRFSSFASSLNSFSLKVSIWSLFLRPPRSSLAGLINGSVTGTTTWLFVPDWVTVSRANATEGTAVTRQLVQTKGFPHPKLHPGSDILAKLRTGRPGRNPAKAATFLLSRRTVCAAAAAAGSISELMLLMFKDSYRQRQKACSLQLYPTARSMGKAPSSRFCSQLTTFFYFDFSFALFVFLLICF